MRDGFEGLSTCNKCGWVAFQVPREFAEAQVEAFNAYFNDLSDHDKEMFGRAASIKTYERCMACGNSYKNFRDAKSGDCPDGCTLSPVLGRNE